MLVPIGISDFSELLSARDLEGCACVFADKTLFIPDILNDSAKIILMLRPRRFGKTLNLSMLHHFFAEEVMGVKTANLFDGLKVSQNKACMERQGQYPVVSISFKDLKETDFKKNYNKLCHMMAGVYRLYDYLLSSDALLDHEKKNFQSILDGAASLAMVEDSLRSLTEYLYRHHKKNVVLLIDEYDTPIHSAYLNGYYDEMANLMRSVLGAALKDNSYIYKSVITGILKIAKESLFSDVNNIEVYSMFSQAYGEYFGFTELEVDALLQEAGITQNRDKIKQWYNGYTMAGAVVYNPWSILKCIKAKGLLAPYWVNTSDNALIQSMLAVSDEVVKKDFDHLVQGQPIIGPINLNLIFSSIKGSRAAILTTLLMAGYLSVVELIDDLGNEKTCRLSCPNQEIFRLYQTLVVDWFAVQKGFAWFTEFLNYLCQGEFDRFAHLLEKVALDFFSVYDVAQGKQENFYHGFTLGILVALQDDYIITSNHEGGLGRYDLAMVPREHLSDRPAILFEFKCVVDGDDAAVAKLAKQALAQIDKKRYANELAKHHGSHLVRIGVGFSGKRLKMLYSR